MIEKLRVFNIEVEDIENIDFEDTIIQQIARKYADEMDLRRFELVLNENIITAKDKFTGINSYMGMKMSLEPLEKEISFIVRPTNEPTYDELKQENQQLKEKYNKLSNDYERMYNCNCILRENRDKAIEEIKYFELQADHLDDNIYLDKTLSNKLLEILKGEENDR